MENEFDLLKLKEMVQTDILTWKSMQVSYKSQIGKIQLEENLTEDSFDTILLIQNLVEYNIYDPADEKICNYLSKIENLLNSDLGIDDIFAGISEIGFSESEKSKIGKTIEMVVPPMMILGTIVIFFNARLGGTIFLSGVGLWALLNGLDLYFATSKPDKINLDTFLYVFLTVFFLGLSVYLFFIIYSSFHQ